MRAFRKRFRLWTLMGVVFAAALGLKGALTFQVWREHVARRRAFSSLGGRIRPSAFKESFLIAALDDPELCRSAVWALDQNGSSSPSLVLSLVKQLETETENSRRQNRWDFQQVDPVKALKRIKPPSEVISPLLQKAMQSKDRWVRLQAIEVLSEVAGRPGPPVPALPPLLLAALQDEEPAICMRAAEMFVLQDSEVRQKAVTILLGQLRAGDRVSQLVATMGLTRFGKEGRAAGLILADQLQEGNTASRLAVLYLIGRLGPMGTSAIPAVVRAMTSRDSGQHVFFFVDCFWKLQQAWHVGQILDSEKWAPPSSNPCSLGIAVLGQIGPDAERQAVDILSGMLPGTEEWQEIRIAEALSELGPKAAASIPTLLALAERGSTTSVGLEYENAVNRRLTVARKVCKSDDPRLVATLVRLLKSNDQVQRFGAALALNSLDPPAAIAAPILVGLLKDEAIGVRSAAASALGRYDGPEGEAAVPALLDALENREEDVQGQAAKSLTRHRSVASRAVPTLIQLLRSEKPQIRREAAETLSAMGPDARLAIPALLLKARDDSDATVRREVRKALKAVESSER